MATIQPDPSEEAMLSVLVPDLLEEAGRCGQVRCRFQRFRILAQRLSPNLRHLTINTDDGALIDADIDIS